MRVPASNALLAIGIAMSPPLPAAVLNVTTTADVVDAADGLLSLREAFVAASANAEADEIVLAATATYTLDDCVAGDLAHTAAEALSVVGNGATIEQSCAGERVIDNGAPGSELSIDGVDFAVAGGGLIDGAAIFARGVANVSNSTMIGLDAGGGAVLRGHPDESTSFVLENVSIDGGDGEGVSANFGALTLIDSSVVGRSGEGVNLVDGSPVLVQNSTISDNGGIGLRTTGLGESEMTLVDATLVGNEGTGVACSGCSTVSITSSTIAGNGGAGGPGAPAGGLHVSLDQDSPDDVRLVSIVDSSIDDNVSGFSGGGIRIDVLESSELTAPPALLQIEGSTVNGNVADGDAPVHGGGIYVETGGISLLDSHVDGNRAGPAAGALEARGGGLYVEELGVVTATSDLTVVGSTVSGNRAADDGGGVYWRKPGAIALEGAAMDDNEALGSGGAVFAVGGDVALLESAMAGNAAAVGGALRIVTFFDQPPGSLLLERSTLADNVASAFGGAIAIDADGFDLPVTLRNSTLDGNDGGGFGGAVYTAFGGDLALEHTSVVGNAATEGANLYLDIGGVFGGFEIDASVVALAVGGTNCELDGGAPTSGGFSFSGDDSCALGPDDLVAPLDPALGPLADNGGATPTRLPDPDSPVGGLVPSAECALATDQRGFARPEGTDCEAGSVEIAEVTPAPIVGTAGNDLLVGTPGDDLILGLGGNDLILGKGGNDTLVGGPGRDFIDGGDGNDRLEGRRGRDVLLGGPGDDELLGGNARDALLGGPGDDTLRGGDGRDALFGGPGDDALDGGRGRDLCVPQGGDAVDC